MSAGFRDSPERALAPGQVIANYEIRDEVARTDTGAVYEAHDRLLDRLVAFKIAWRDQGTPSLITETRRCAAVRDPCAVQIHGMGKHEGVEYAVGERVTGILLKDELGKTLPEEVYMQRLRKIVAAVARAHEGGIAVGDISGSTVLVAPDGRLVLGRLSLSQVPAYGPLGHVLAPEVARGEIKPGDPAAAEAIDLYGLGCVAIELACGNPPFADDEINTLRGHAQEAPPRILDLRPDLPGELSDLVDWLLAKQPVARPRSVRDVLAQLDAIIERYAAGSRPVRVLIVDDDTSRLRWLWSLARRAHAGAIVETASEGQDAAHKLNRDQPELVFVDAALKGMMNALELCMYARGLEAASRSQFTLIGDIGDKDRALLSDVTFIKDDDQLANAVIDRVRAIVNERPRHRKIRTTISG